MKAILYLSVALIAVAFFILVLYLVKTLKTVQGTLVSLTKTIEGMEKQINEIGAETAQLLHKTNAVADQAQKKLENLNALFDAAKQMGATVQRFNDSLSRTLMGNERKMAQAVQWGNAFLEIWENWKERKQKKIEEGMRHGKK